MATAPMQQMSKIIFVVVRMTNSSLDGGRKFNTSKSLWQLGGVHRNPRGSSQRAVWAFFVG
jgi:hypothetical protein